MGSFSGSVRENTKKPSTLYHSHHESLSLICATASIPIFFILLSSRSQITTLIISILNLLTISLSSQWSTLEPTFVILLQYFCDIIVIFWPSYCHHHHHPSDQLWSPLLWYDAEEAEGGCSINFPPSNLSPACNLIRIIMWSWWS